MSGVVVGGIIVHMMIVVICSIVVACCRVIEVPTGVIPHPSVPPTDQQMRDVE